MTLGKNIGSHVSTYASYVITCAGSFDEELKDKGGISIGIVHPISPVDLKLF